MIILKVDEEVQGTSRGYDSVTEVMKNLKELLDERTYEVIIKKRAAGNSSSECNVGCSE